MTSTMKSTAAIDSQAIPSINPVYRLQWEEAQQSWVLLYPEGMVQLNGPAGEIMSLIDGQSRVAQVIDTLQGKYADAGDISGDIIEFLEDAREQRWITL